jgi:hypothetical protein
VSLPTDSQSLARLAQCPLLQDLTTGVLTRSSHARGLAWVSLRSRLRGHPRVLAVSEEERGPLDDRYSCSRSSALPRTPVHDHDAPHCPGVDPTGRTMTGPGCPIASYCDGDSLSLSLQLSRRTSNSFGSSVRFSAAHQPGPGNSVASTAMMMSSYHWPSSQQLCRSRPSCTKPHLRYDAMAPSLNARTRRSTRWTSIDPNA